MEQFETVVADRRHDRLLGHTYCSIGIFSIDGTMTEGSGVGLNLMLIGTAHVIDLKIPLEIYIREFEPHAVALELDRERWLHLTLRKNGPEVLFL